MAGSEVEKVQHLHPVLGTPEQNTLMALFQTQHCPAR
jgi:hypothetical protein